MPPTKFLPQLKDYAQHDLLRLEKVFQASPKTEFFLLYKDIQIRTREFQDFIANGVPSESLVSLFLIYLFELDQNRGRLKKNCTFEYNVVRNKLEKIYSTSQAFNGKEFFYLVSLVQQGTSCACLIARPELGYLFVEEFYANEGTIKKQEALTVPIKSLLAQLSDAGYESIFAQTIKRSQGAPEQNLLQVIYFVHQFCIGMEAEVARRSTIEESKILKNMFLWLTLKLKFESIGDKNQNQPNSPLRNPSEHTQKTPESQKINYMAQDSPFSKKLSKVIDQQGPSSPLKNQSPLQRLGRNLRASASHQVLLDIRAVKSDVLPVSDRKLLAEDQQHNHDRNQDYRFWDYAQKFQNPNDVSYPHQENKEYANRILTNSKSPDKRFYRGSRILSLHAQPEIQANQQQQIQKSGPKAVRQGRTTSLDRELVHYGAAVQAAEEGAQAQQQKLPSLNHAKFYPDIFSKNIHLSSHDLEKLTKRDIVTENVMNFVLQCYQNNYNLRNQNRKVRCWPTVVVGNPDFYRTAVQRHVEQQQNYRQYEILILPHYDPDTGEYYLAVANTSKRTLTQFVFVKHSQEKMAVVYAAVRDCLEETFGGASPLNVPNGTAEVQTTQKWHWHVSNSNGTPKTEEYPKTAFMLLQVVRGLLFSKLKKIDFKGILEEIIFYAGASKQTLQTE